MDFVELNDISKRKTIEIAQEMGVDVQWALKQRLQYLLDKKQELQSKIDWFYEIILDGELNSVTEALFGLCIESCERQMKKIDTKVRTLTVRPSKGQITEDMIEYAREVPIERVIEFKSCGRTFAFCHDSDGYSLAKSNSSNGAWCHRCQRFFNPVDTLIERDG